MNDNIKENIKKEDINRENYDAVLFDLDGVLTNTAKIHSACWKKLFDDFLKAEAEKKNEEFKPFTERDYLDYVDGKMRYNGVESFLESRGFKLPYGHPDDKPGVDTACALGNQKNSLFGEILERDGVEIYQGSLDWVHKLIGEGFKVAVVSSSHRCKEVLKSSKMDHLFPVVVDGNVVRELGLNGKPAPDGFLKAARDLGVEAKRAVVIEDAVFGVEAGKNGGFGLVVGVDRTNNAENLFVNGANIVVKDLKEFL